ncbi:hypothetical protein BO99DRAFT_245926 [Aspergillus violaceofuscus CBS 115571]|uniref:Uncharacterized protein n=1 Tax=Aspergillus violaceofuscus (strain CBS 115571) TaxID=1450538 RepID=A0A2V5H1I3_ASPV1|nr:hypothetical protein BO99DRAFT_245926 [Aspergillus violaceofuscus CBS 115571]
MQALEKPFCATWVLKCRVVKLDPPPRTALPCRGPSLEQAPPPASHSKTLLASSGLRRSPRPNLRKD